MKQTPNLGLPLALSGHVQLQRSVKTAFEILDTAAGGSGGVDKDFAPIATANASDPATTMALVNELKAKINEMAAETFRVAPGPA